MGETRRCEQCGREFAPRREHARFCSGECRISWNKDRLGEEGSDLSALQWSVTELAEQMRRLPGVPAGDRAAAAGTIGELVWQATIVDATIVRYYPDVYDAVLDALPAGQRRAVAGVMGGLRFVRNQMRGTGDAAGFLSSAAVGQDSGRSAGQEPAAAPWRWAPAARPPLAGLAPRGREWELERYRAYQAFLAGHATGETFGRVTAFLQSAADAVAAEAAVSQPAG